MNIREVEALLRELVDTLPDGHALQQRVISAIHWCVRQQRSAAKRKLEFKLKAAERREALR